MSGKAREHEISESARILFMKKGFEQTTMDEIAFNAKLTVASLYKYFKCKEDLFAITTMDVLKRFETKLISIAGSTYSTQAKFKNIFHVFIQEHENNPNCLINLLHFQSSDNLKKLSEKVRIDLEEHSKRVQYSMIAVVQHGIQEGIIVDQNPVFLVDTLWGVCSGVILWSNSKNLLNTVNNFVTSTSDVAFRLFWKGLTKP